MPSKRLREEAQSLTSIPDVRTSHDFLSINEYSRDTIGMQSFLTRQFENEHFGKLFHQLGRIEPRLKDYYDRLESMEKKMLKEKSNSDLERCAIIIRLRLFLKQNEVEFQEFINRNNAYLQQCMTEKLYTINTLSDSQFIQDCIQRNEAAFKRHKVQRMRRFHFYDYNEILQPENAISLQNWIMAHFERFINTMAPQPSEQMIAHFNLLLSDSFFINQHPSPPVATYVKSNKDGVVTANVQCKLLCLLDLSNKAITINKMVPVVRRLTTSNQQEECNIAYNQQPLEFSACSIVTGSNTNKIFYYADLTKIVLEQSTASTGKIHYAQHVYIIEFQIHITVQIENNSFQRYIIVHSGPFGLVSNTVQLPNLLADVYLQDLKSWKQTSLASQTINPVNNTDNLLMVNLTNEEIMDNLKRYFIHKTGIEPREWMISYITQELNVECDKQKGHIDVVRHDLLAKILPQIDYMAEHSLLTLLYWDGLFQGICNCTMLHKFLQEINKRNKASICAMRFSAINSMADTKTIPVRIDLVDNSSSDIQNLTFETNTISFELVYFIVKIALGEALRFEYILTNLSMDERQLGTYDLSKLIQYYYSDKLRDICPQEEKYNSIWNITDKKKKDVSVTSPTNLFQNLALSPHNGTTTEMENNNSTYSPLVNTNTNYGTQSYPPYHNPIQSQLPQTQIPNQQFQYEMSQNPQHQYQPQPSQSMHQQQQQLPFQQQQQIQFQQQQYYSPQPTQQNQLQQDQFLLSQGQQQQLYQNLPQASQSSNCFHCGHPCSNVPPVIVIVNQNDQPATPILLQQVINVIPELSSSTIRTAKIYYVSNNNSHPFNLISQNIISQRVNAPNPANSTENAQ